MSCQNPCGTVPANSAASESLPSQIENFTKQFFGTVVKTEVDGVVNWSLPCNLDVGLPANPRGVDEGLACYFLRLFLDGIVGLKGDTGATGPAGTNGNNAYTVTLASFVQPTLGSPNVQVVTQYNPAILDGMYLFIATSGWYLVEGSDGTGVLFLRLTTELPGASGTITAGKVVTASGTPGASITGATGAQGPQGVQGPAGDTTTETNGSFFTAGGTDYSVPLVYAVVDLTSSDAQVTLPVAGKYLITAMVRVKGIGAVVAADLFSVKLRNISNSADVDGSEAAINGLGVDSIRTLTLSAIATTDAANQTVSLFSHGSVANVFEIQSDNVLISYVRLQ